MEAGADVNAANLKVMSIMVALANRGLSEELLFDPALAQSGLVDVLPLPNVRAPLSLLSFLSFLSFLSPLPNVRAPPLSPLSPLVPLAALSQPRFLVGLRAGGPRFSASPFSPSSPHLAPVGAPQIQRHVWRGPAGLGERADLGRGGRLGAHARQPPAAAHHQRVGPRGAAGAAGHAVLALCGRRRDAARAGARFARLDFLGERTESKRAPTSPEGPC